MAAKALIPVEEYLRTSYEDLDREYVDGEVVERPMPPCVAVEILSPGDTATRLREKLLEYRALGVPHIWVIDPYARAISEFSSDGLRDVRSMLMPELGIEITPAEVFSELDEEQEEKGPVSQ